MRFLAAIRSLFEPVDAVASEAVERDIDDEFAFHIEQLEAELRREGMDDETARAEARRRFGDEELLRRCCRWIAMKEHIMLQRVNAVVTVVLLAAVGLMGVLLFNAQRHNAVATEALMSQVEMLRSQLDDVSVADAPPATFQALGRFRNQGKYVLTPGMKLSEAVVLAEPTGSDLHFEVRHYNGKYVQLKGTVAARELFESPTSDFELSDGDIVEAKTQLDTTYATSTPPVATGIVYLDGDIERAGKYAMPQYSQLTLARLLAGARISDQDMRVTVRRHNVTTQQDEIVWEATISELRSNIERDLRLMPDDYVQVAALAEVP